MNQSIFSSDNVVHLDHTPLQLNSLYIAIGLEEEDVGYPVVSQATDELGDRIALTSSLWHVSTRVSLHDAFRTINSSMLDRRIDYKTSLVILNPSDNHSKWHLRQPLSDLMYAHWDFENNIFISFALHDTLKKQKPLVHCLTGLGTWAPLSRTVWYLSTAYSSKEVFQKLLYTIGPGDQLCVLDSKGHLAIWQDGKSIPSLPKVIDQQIKSRL